MATHDSDKPSLSYARVDANNAGRVMEAVAYFWTCVVLVPGSLLAAAFYTAIQASRLPVGTLVRPMGLTAVLLGSAMIASFFSTIALAYTISVGVHHLSKGKLLATIVLLPVALLHLPVVIVVFNYVIVYRGVQMAP